MKRFASIVVALLLEWAALPSAWAQEPARLVPVPEGTRVADFETQIKPLAVKYCFACHAGEKAKGGLAFDKLTTEAAIRQRRDLASRVYERLEGELMPPEDQPQPTEAERALFLHWLDRRILNIPCDGPIDPGRVTMRRLNRAEYNNTIRDLLGVDFKPAEDFPSDDVGYGFDNIGDVLSMPPVLLEKYLAAAEKITQAAILTGDPGQAPRKSANGRKLTSVAEVTLEFEILSGAEYLLRARAWAEQAGPELARMALKLDGKEVKIEEVSATGGAGRDYEVRLPLEAGKHVFAARFINDYYKPDDPDRKNRDRNLIVEKLEVVGPIGTLPENLPESHRRLITCRPADRSQAPDCARAILRPFAQRAWRRPVEEDELQRLMRLATDALDAGESFESGIQLAVQAVLLSPHFLFRVELDPEPGSPAPRGLNDWELATRLSYFLWSSMPDDELYRLASAGALRGEGNLAAQVRRMLKDPKSAALVDNFASQWLQLRNLKSINPDRKRFPKFDDALRQAMEQETRMFFESIMREDRSILEFLSADYSFVNERLASHYGLPDVQGDEFRRVALPPAQRGGLLGQASILTVTSNPTRTSPVKRGKWILENLLNAPPPPPPPGVPELDAGNNRVLSGSLRQRMEQHRENRACAVCHAQMDALGFGLENYDPIGAWRTRDEEFEIDASGTLPGGDAFSGPEELRAVLRKRQAEFRRCLAEKLLTYALGRGLEYYDKCTVDRIVRNLEAGHDRFSALVLEIVTSEPFLKRRGLQGNEP